MSQFIFTTCDYNSSTGVRSFAATVEGNVFALQWSSHAGFIYAGERLGDYTAMSSDPRIGDDEFAVLMDSMTAIECRAQYLETLARLNANGG